MLITYILICHYYPIQMKKDLNLLKICILSDDEWFYYYIFLKPVNYSKFHT